MIVKGLRDADFAAEYLKFVRWAGKRLPYKGSADPALDLAFKGAKAFEQSATMTLFDYQLWLQRFTNQLSKNGEKAIEWAASHLKTAVAMDRQHTMASGSKKGSSGTVEAGLFGGRQTFASIGLRLYYQCTGGTDLNQAQKKKMAESVAIIACVHSKSRSLGISDFVALEKKIYAQLRATKVPDRPTTAGRLLVLEAERLKNQFKKEKAESGKTSAAASGPAQQQKDCCPDFNTKSRTAVNKPKRLLKTVGGMATVQSQLPDGLIDHREEGVCPKTGERMIKAQIRGENPQEVWFAEGSRVVMPIKQ
jgi:hypothetical protein